MLITGERHLRLILREYVEQRSSPAPDAVPKTACRA
jgi:hypothetical protein